MKFSDQLRKAITLSGMSLYRIGKDANVEHATLRRFMKEQKGLRSETVDNLVAFLGLELVKKKAPRKKKLR